MPRQALQLFPARPIAPMRQAASVLLLQDTAQGLEVLLTQRTAAASFAASMMVFPGGVCDPADTHAASQTHLVQRHALQDDAAVACALCAIRECFEEVGVLLACHADGRYANQDDVDALHAHIGRHNTASVFYTACAQAGLRLQADGLMPFSRWIAPLDLPKRFDTTFLLARMPQQQTPRSDGQEQVHAEWVRPSMALEHKKQKRWDMLFPTLENVRQLLAFAQVEAALNAYPHDVHIAHVAPRGAQRQGKEVRLRAGDLAYGELSLVAPHGHIQHSIDWQHTHAVPLLQHVQRLTAPNANRMTGSGTNSYLVGTPSSGYMVIDPGPADPEHVQRLHAISQGDIRAIVCTHSHPDHSPGAALLQALCPHRPPIYGLPHGPQARSDSHFAPDQVLHDGHTLVLHEPDSSSHTLQAIHTPGHTANHLCLLLQEDGLLFSGDHILNGSTTVVMPPDGHMGDYLASLDKLLQLCHTHAVSHILPAHGYVLEHAGQAIAQLKAHRLQREAKVRTAMQQIPDGDLDDWLPLAYADTPEALWPIARHSLRAHVEHVQEHG